MDHADCDCLVVVVMSHGLPNKIFAYDKEYDVDLLWNQFTPDNCPSLTGKPKLFFIQVLQFKTVYVKIVLNINFFLLGLSRYETGSWC